MKMVICLHPVEAIVKRICEQSVSYMNVVRTFKSMARHVIGMNRRLSIQYD